MSSRICFSVLALFTTLAMNTMSAHADVIDLKTRDTTIRLLIEAPFNPSHVIGLLPGGKGTADIETNGSIGAGAGNFAVRTRKLLQAHGFVTAVIAPPGDIPNLAGNRHRDEYAEDIGNVVGYLRTRFNLPVWLHGTSRGAISISMTLPKIADTHKRPDGIVLSAGVTRQNRNGRPSALDGDLSGYVGAALVLHHKNDPCSVTRPDDAPGLIDALTRARFKQLVWIDGGDALAKGRDCGAKTQHGFIGVEDTAINAIAGFIKADGKND